MRRIRSLALMIVACVALVACESDEERAEAYYQSALELLAAGDEERALIELRNVFEHDGFHFEARKLYADTLYARGDVSGAYGQYLRLIEQYPDTLEVRLVLVEISMSRQGDPNAAAEIERHSQAARELAPEDPRVRAVLAALEYSKGSIADNDQLIADAVVAARAVLEETPDNLVARRVLILAALRAEQVEEALVEIDAYLALETGDLDIYQMKFVSLSVQDRTEDNIAAITAHLEETYERFPEGFFLSEGNPVPVRAVLLGWYQEQDRPEEVERLLREWAGPPSENVEMHFEIVTFIERTRGRDAAIAELDALIAATEGTPNAALFTAAKARLTYQPGDPEGAIPLMRGVIEGAEPSDEIRQIQVGLAELLIREGDVVAARALIEEVIEQDSSQVEALKIRAQWLIDELKTEEAIIDLRTALAQAPADAGILFLMAEAQEDLGNLALAQERLARAVEIAEQDPNVTVAAAALRYAEFLIQQGQVDIAETVLVSARDKVQSPAQIEYFQLSQVLAQIWLGTQNWPQLDGLVEELKLIDIPEYQALVLDVERARLFAVGEIDEGLALLAQQLEGADPIIVEFTSIRALFQSGAFDEARARLDVLLAEEPDNEALRLMDASLLLQAQDLEGAKEVYRGIIAGGAQTDRAYFFLARIARAEGKNDEAQAIYEAGREAFPNSGDLANGLAELLIEMEDYLAAIELYEVLYGSNRDNLALANNLASLLSAHTTSPEDLERAYNIARRFRESDFPYFQDTYGWIEYRRGNYETALEALEPAAAALPDQPLVQVHLGLTYVALERFDEARPVLERGLDMAEGQTHPQFDRAREALEALPAPSE